MSLLRLSFVLAILSCAAVAQNAERAGRIRQAIDQAHAEGKTHIRAQAGVGIPGQCLTGLSDCIRWHTLLIGNVEKIVTSIDPTEQVIWSWYKLRVNKPIHGEIPNREDIARMVPKDLLPIGSENVVLRMIGGTAQREGVTVELAGEYGALKLTEQYLLFVAFPDLHRNAPDGDAAGAIPLGDAGVFILDGLGVIHPRMPDTLIANEIAKSCAGTVEGLRTCLH